MSIQSICNEVPEIAYKLCYTKERKGRLGVCGTFRTVLSFGSTCQKFHAMINKDVFCFPLKNLINKKYLVQEEMNECQGFFARQFRLMTDWDTNSPQVNSEKFQGSMWGDAFSASKGPELFIMTKPIRYFLLDKNSKEITLEIPENERVPSHRNKLQPCLARSDKSIAINLRCDSAINIFCAKENKFLFKIMASGLILQMEFKNDSLLVREVEDEDHHKLSIFNLKTKEKFKEILLPSFSSSPYIDHFPLCFGKTQVFGICEVDEEPFFVQDLEGKTDPIKGDVFSCLSERSLVPLCVFPDGKGFMVVGAEENNSLTLAKVTISDGTMHSKIVEDKIEAVLASRKIEKVLYYRGKLFLVHSADLLSSPKITTYDLETKNSITFLNPVPVLTLPYPHKFLVLANKVYFLAVGANFAGEVKTYLIKLDYG